MSTRKQKSQREPESFPEQTEFEGMETPKLAALDKKGRLYLDVKDKAKKTIEVKKRTGSRVHNPYAPARVDLLRSQRSAPAH